jgi:hypothetical protein
MKKQMKKISLFLSILIILSVIGFIFSIFFLIWFGLIKFIAFKIMLSSVLLFIITNKFKKIHNNLNI